jgi:hypothetical protein
VSKIMRLTNLAHEIQKGLLFLPKTITAPDATGATASAYFPGGGLEVAERTIPRVDEPIRVMVHTPPF